MPKIYPPLTAERLRELLSYDPETGVFRRTKRRQGVRVGRISGSVGSSGYHQIKMDGVKHLCHRLAWLYVHGRWPADEIDHINGNPSDNRICNLREATHAENSQNMAKQSNNTSGHAGIFWEKRERRWRVRIMVRGKRIGVGYFKDIDAAISARREAKALHHTFHPHDPNRVAGNSSGPRSIK